MDRILENIDPSNKTPSFFRKCASEHFPTPYSLWEIFVEYGVDQFRHFQLYSESQRIGEYIKMDEKMKSLGLLNLKKLWSEWQDVEETRNIWDELKLNGILRTYVNTFHMVIPPSFSSSHVKMDGKRGFLGR